MFEKIKDFFKSKFTKNVEDDSKSTPESKKSSKKAKDKKGLVVVLGCSRLGAQIACNASLSGNDVYIVDKDEKAFDKLLIGFNGTSILGDATEKSVLDDCELKKADEVIITTDDDNTNIYLASMIVNQYPINFIVVRLRDDSKAPLLNNSKIKIITPNKLSMKDYENLQRYSGSVKVDEIVEEM